MSLRAVWRGHATPVQQAEVDAWLEDRREALIDSILEVGLGPVVIPVLELTKAEAEVLGAIADGLTMSAVAKLRHTSVATAKAQAADMRRKLGAINSPHAVALAFQRGLLPIVAAT